MPLGKTGKSGKYTTLKIYDCQDCIRSGLSPGTKRYYGLGVKEIDLRLFLLPMPDFQKKTFKGSKRF
jgi:hypothetical protein